MAVKVVKEPREFLTSQPECCFSCYTPTRHWHEGKDVPCCPACAKNLTDDEVPTKLEWVAKAREKVDGGALGEFLERLADGKIRF
jgi:predicted amidophosphoribosyltransferase